MTRTYTDLSSLLKPPVLHGGHNGDGVVPHLHLSNGVTSSADLPTLEETEEAETTAGELLQEKKPHDNQAESVRDILSFVHDEIVEEEEKKKKISSTLHGYNWEDGTDNKKNEASVEESDKSTVTATAAAAEKTKPNEHATNDGDDNEDQGDDDQQHYSSFDQIPDSLNEAIKRAFLSE